MIFIPWVLEMGAHSMYLLAKLKMTPRSFNIMFNVFMYSKKGEEVLIWQAG